MSALTRADRLNAALTRAKDKIEHTTEQTIRATATVAGGFASGVIEAKKPTIGPSNFRTTTLVGGGLLALGLLGFAKKNSDHLISVGAGILAADARELGRNAAT